MSKDPNASPLNNQRLFSDDQLAEFTKGHIELALEALEKNDIASAKYWCQRNEDTKHWIHDHYVYWVASLLSLIQKKYGEDDAVEALKQTYFQPMLELEKVRREVGVKAYMTGWFDNILRHHGMMPGLKIVEDDEKFIITFGRCGSGGFLIDRGDYGGAAGFTLLTKARPETWGEENVPVYCAHCTQVEIWSNLLSGEKAQNIVIADRKLKPGQPCVLHFYKDASKVPEKYIARIGMNQTHWHQSTRGKRST
ncbi:MAG: hypothetical protein R3E74_00920 [Pseudomonadales bacterium]|nr:hypothetical protein [Pseudomonadales bacterium]